MKHKSKNRKMTSLQNLIDTLNLVYNIEIENVFESNIHNYFKLSIGDCVIYNVCGYITKILTKQISCEICFSAVNGKFITDLKVIHFLVLTRIFL